MLHELRLGVRHWSSWLCTAALSLLVILVVYTASASYLYWYTALTSAVSNIIFFQFPLIAALGAWMLLRHRPQGFDWVWATPQDGYQLLGKQILTLLVQVLLIQCVALSVLSVLLVLRGEINISSVPLIYGYGLLLLLPATLVQLGMIVMLTLLFQHLLFVIGSVLGLAIMTWLGLLMPVATLFTPLNITWLTVSFNPLTKFGPDTQLVVNLMLLYAMIALLLGSLGLLGARLRDHRIRLRRRSRVLLMSTLGVSLLVAAAAGLLHRTAVAQQLVPASQISQYRLWKVEHATTELELSSEELAYTQQLTLQNTSDAPRTTLVLQLNPGMNITSALVDQNSVAVERFGETIQVSLTKPVQPQQMLEIDLVVAGRLSLLREDYAREADIASSPSAAYQRPVRNYHDAAVFLLGRDGDWRAWPLGDTIQQATRSDTIELQVTTFAQPLLASAADQSTTFRWQPSAPTESTERTQPLDIQATNYRWEHPLPELLAVGGEYVMHSGDQADYLLSAHATTHDKAYVEQIAQLYATLRTIDPALPERPQVMQVPYLDRMLLGGSIVAVPFENPVQTIETKLLSNDYWQLRPLAQQLSYAWFASNAQTVLPLSTTGQLISFQRFCDTDAEGNQHCSLIYNPDNSQVSQPRLVPLYTVDPALYAASVLLGQHLTVTATNDQQSQQDELDEWRAMVEPPRDAFFVSGHVQQLFLRRSGLNLGSQLDLNEKLVASMIIDTHSLIHCHKPPLSFAELRTHAQQHGTAELLKGGATCE